MSFIDKLKSLFGSHPQPAKEAPAADAPVQKPVSEAAAEDKTAAFEWIRDRILESVKNRRRLVAVLGALEPGSADPAFPPRYGRNWDYIDICLRVVTGEIYADLSMDDGSQHEERPITPEQLHENGRRWGLDARYAYLKTEADWQLLITKELRQQAMQSVVYAGQKKNQRNRTDAPPAAKPDPAPVAPTSAPVKVKRQKPPENLARIRESVIKTVRARKTYEVPLCSWLWGEAAARFPGGPYSGWEYAGIQLNVKTHKLGVDLSRYPNQFGASEQTYQSLTPERFQAKMKDWGVPELYWDMRTQEDWDELFDESLNEAVAELDRIKAKEAEAVRLRHCVVIPDAMYTARPAMKYTDVAMTLDQRYGATTVTVCQSGGAYRVQIGGRSYLGRSPSGNTVTLTAAEAVWLEDRVQRALQDGGSSTFSSLPGGDRMSVDIRQGSQLLESSNMTAPLNKYVQLLSSLEQLVRYGSIRESETDRTPD